MFFSFLNRPSVVAIAPLSIQRFFLIFEIVTMTIRIVALTLGFLIFKDDVVAIMLFSLTGMLLNIFLIFKTLKHAKLLRRIS